MLRYPIEIEEGKHAVASVPDDLFEILAAVEAHGQKLAESACHAAQVALLGKHQVANTNHDAVMAVVRKDPRLPDEVKPLPAHLFVHIIALETRPEMLQHEGQDANCDTLLGAHRSNWLAATPEFEEESQIAEEEMQHWERCVSAFRATYGRAPVMYDLFCGEGTMGRGAILAGAEVIGFDIARRPSTYGFKA
eukprot:4502611-Pleurochrysis_carterae.AAC.1